MSDLLKEFEDDLRRERSEKRWKDFGKQMVNISLAVVIGTVGAVIWKHYMESKSVEQTSLLMRGMERMEVEDYKGAIEVFSSAAEKLDDDEKADIALLKKAEAQLAIGDKAGAEQTYQALSKRKVSSPFVAIAQLQSAKDASAFSDARKGEPFYHMKMEWKGWKLLEQDKKQEAAEIFASLQNDSTTPASVRGRTAEALQLIAPEKLVPDMAGVDADAK